MCHPKPIVKIGDLNYLFLLQLPGLAEVLPDIAWLGDLGSLRNVRWWAPAPGRCCGVWPFLWFVWASLRSCEVVQAALACRASPPAQVVTRVRVFRFRVASGCICCVGGDWLAGIAADCD